MASNHTEHYELNQWSASDPVLREEFNADNATIDAALATIPKVAAGEYTGDGAATRVITVGFTPKMVYLCDIEGTTYIANGSQWWYGGLATAEYPMSAYGVDYLNIVEGGFQVVQMAVQESSSYWFYYYASNSEKKKYRYFAIG